MASDHRRRDYQYVEGPKAAQQFDSSMRRILSVPKDELTKREADYKKTRHTKKPRRPAK
jgi:hypothetical protein